MSKIKSLLLTGSLLITIICTGFSANATERHLLEQTISYEDLGTAILYHQSWVDYPKYTDRKSWQEKVDPEIRKIIIKNGEQALKHEWKPDLASDYLAFKRTGEIRTGRANHKEDLWMLS